MTTAAEILAMIEAVDPSDSAKLDEIDARVWCYLESRNYSKCVFQFSSEIGLMQQTHYNGDFEQLTFKPYTRSRDALKAIRPNRWGVRIYNGHDYNCVCYIWHVDNLHSIDHNYTGLAKTEELAELHAIIQALDYERNSK